MLAPRRQARIRASVRFRACLVWHLGRPVVIDTETTDFVGEIIEVAVVDGRTGAPLLTTLIKPDGPINPEATEVHHITDQMCANAPSWGEVWPQLHRLLRWRVICAWNAPYDRSRLTAACTAERLRQPPMPWWCLMRADAAARGSSWRALNAGHRAVADARAAQRVLTELAGR